MTELVGEVEPELAERLIEIDGDRRLDEARPDVGLISQATHIGQSPGQFAALGEQQLEGFGGDVVPSDPATALCLERQLQPAGIGVQAVGHEMTAQPPACRAATARFEAMLRRMSQRCPTRREWCVVGTGNGTDARRSLLQAIGEPLRQLVALRGRH